MSERITENIVRKLLRENNYYDSDSQIVVEEQKSKIKAIDNLLKIASKSSTGNSGYPEFIINWDVDTNFVIVIECKASVKNHASIDLNKPKDYAVDGVLHYAKHLSKKFTVIAIAVSGQNESELKVSNYLYPCGADDYKDLTNIKGTLVDEILSFNKYYQLSSYDPIVEKIRHQDLIAFSKKLHELIWTAAKVSEEEKPLLVSGTLIALMYKPFLLTYQAYDAETMPTKWLEAIREVLNRADIPRAKKETMLQPYASVAAQPNLGKPDAKVKKKYPQGVLAEIINNINDNVWPFINVYHNFDVVGHFYGEFLKYTGGDKKALGIVLTPRHITELFCEIANVSKKDTVLDICAGTGGFLISSMQAMLKQAVTDKEEEGIKKNQLIGIENNPKMFSLAASNMILRGDGKANLYQSSCFEPSLQESIIAPKKDSERKRPNIGLLNPPYAQSKSDAELHELYFVKEMLDMLEEGGIGVAIIPVSCVITPNKAKAEVLKFHTLKAVMSMPSELFYPVATVTCIVVFEAHKPHMTPKVIDPITNKTIEHKKAFKKTWFGYWRDDGFEKTKHLGRIDLNDTWLDIKQNWLEQYRNNEVHPGESVTAYVTDEDEWIAEAYLETDYSTITQDKFEEVVTNYALFKLLNRDKASKVEDK
ncbi:HsdM family class I SAM-dependent methyltransferase [Psychrobacter proteolyticus]|uniref:site-specific DNA-methyltransferase (adenine-specific) n=1 Tax=Psychrobacter proteolyticus TaxID=147825 RepID=A0ABV0D6U2_9GAMM